MATRKARKPRTTPEQREARREADAALIEAATARLDGDEAGAELAAYLLARPGLARLSVKNCAILAEQAEQRGVADLSDVRTFAGWREVGRAVKRGSKAYRLIVPRHEDQGGAEGAEAGDGGDEAADDEAKPKRPRFWLKAAWFDIAQTEGIDDEPNAE